MELLNGTTEEGNSARCGTETSFCNWQIADEFLDALDQGEIRFTFQTYSDDKSLKRIDTNYVGYAPGDVAPKGARLKKTEVDPNAKVHNSALTASLRERLEKQNQKGVGVFVTVNTTDLKGRKRDNFRKVRAVWADFDNGLPASFPLQPSALVNSSPGRYHAYWFVGDEMPLELWRGVMVGIVRNYGGDASVTDPTRVMRLPGTCHMKTGKPHFVSITESARDAGGFMQAYSAATIIKAFPPVEIVTRAKAINFKMRPSTTEDAERVASALDYIADLPSEDDPRQSNVRNRASWFRVLCALKHEYGDAGLLMALDWSKQCSEVYDEDNACAVWTSIKDETYGGKPFTVGSIIHWATKAGWVRPGSIAEVHSLASLSASAAAMAAVAVDPSSSATEPETSLEFGRKVSNWNADLAAQMLKMMNLELAIMPTASGKVRIMYRKHNAAGRLEICFMSAEDVAALFANIRFDVEGKKRTAYQAWFEWKDRTQYTGCGTYPGSSKNPARVPRGFLNLWPGYAIQPKKGDWSLMQAHLLDKICKGNQAHYDWLIDWFAQMVQEPQKKGRSSVVLRSSKKGTGKTMIAKYLLKALGKVVTIANTVEQITGRFNSALDGNLLTVAEEAIWGGNKAAEGVIKAIITDETIRVEPKGLEAYDAPNFTRLLVLSNNDWAAPVDIHERRWFVLDVDHDQANDPAYFDPIHEQMNDDGLAAMLHDLLERKIKSDLGRPPETEALRNQRAHGLDGLHRWLRDVAEGGGVLSSDERQMFSAKDTTELSRDCVKASAREFVKGYEERSLDTRLGILLRSVGVDDGSRSTRGGGGRARERTWLFPPAAEFAEKVAARLAIAIDHA